MIRKSMNKLSIVFLSVCLMIGCIFAVPSVTRADAAVTLTITNVKINSVSQYTGSKIYLSNATAVGGTAPRRFKFVYKINNGNWKVIRYFTTQNYAEFTTTSPGTYTIRTYVRDKYDNERYIDKRVVILPKYTPIKNNSTISGTTFNEGQNITLNGKASGGTAPYSYAYYQTKQDGARKEIVKSFTTNNKINFKLTAGYYRIDCIAKDKDGSKISKVFDITVKKNTGTALKNESTSALTAISSGGTLKLTGKGSGGTQPYQYKFAYTLDGKNFTQISNYSKSALSSCKLTKIGFYTIRAYVKDMTGKVVTKDIKNITVKKNTGKNMTISSSINVGSLVDQGASTVIKIKGYGGTQPFKYAYYYSLNNASWQKIKDYSTSESVSYKFSNAGNYRLKAVAKDADGNTKEKIFTTRSITKQSYANCNKGTKSTYYGFSVNITATNRGSGSKYAIYYKIYDSDTWSVLQNYSTNQTVSFRPRYLDKYIVMICAQSGGKNYTETYYVTSQIKKEVYEVLRLVNAERKKAGVKELKLDTDMVFACGVRSEEIRKKYSHTRPDGTLFSTIFDEYDVDYSTIFGENIDSADSVQEAMKDWMASDKHRKHILDPVFTKTGINFNGTLWSELFSD